MKKQLNGFSVTLILLSLAMTIIAVLNIWYQ